MQPNQHTNIKEREARQKKIVAYAKAHPSARLVDIAEAIGVSTPVISRTLTAAGMGDRKVGKRPRLIDPELVSKAQQMHSSGLSLRSIGRALGVPYYSVKTILS